jgi:hypothetical protein
MTVSYTVEDGSFRAERPKPWAETRFTPRPRRRSFDLHPDGTRLAAATVQDAQDSVAQDRVVFITNFFDELRRLAPTR